MENTKPVFITLAEILLSNGKWFSDGQFLHFNKIVKKEEIEDFFDPRGNLTIGYELLRARQKDNDLNPEGLEVVSRYQKDGKIGFIFSDEVLSGILEKWAASLVKPNANHLDEIEAEKKENQTPEERLTEATENAVNELMYQRDIHATKVPELMIKMQGHIKEKNKLKKMIEMRLQSDLENGSTFRELANMMPPRWAVMATGAASLIFLACFAAFVALAISQAM